jgi:hypothetical protein
MQQKPTPYNITLIIGFIWNLFISFTAVGETVFTPLPTDIAEPTGIYYPDPPDLLQVNLTTFIQQGSCVIDDYSGCTLNDVYNDNNSSDNFKPEVRVNFQSSDYSSDSSANAAIRQRGNSARFADLKSYRIKLDKTATLWRGENRLQLNKHPYEITRVRNKLSFDMMQEIPHLPSLRTQFVNMTINDQPYGLFTHVEHVGKKYLQRRGWHKDSPLYKANDFDYHQNSALNIDNQGKPIDETAFDAVLEIERGKKHFKLIEMLNALNNENNDFMADVFDKYYNRNNYLTWLATNILIGNVDARSSNFYLLNPKSTDQFYLLPWDYDDTWGITLDPFVQAHNKPLPRWKKGISMWWKLLLHERFFRQPGSVELIRNAVEELKLQYFTPLTIQTKLDSYYDIVFPVISQDLDLFDLETVADSGQARLEEYNQVYAQLSSQVENNYQNFLETLGDPMPFRQHTPQMHGNLVTFTWGNSIDLQGATVSYDLLIANSPRFEPASLLHTVEGLTQPAYQYQWTHPHGSYFYRVIARSAINPQQHWQESTNSYQDIGYGIKQFNIGATTNNNAPNGFYQNPPTINGTTVSFNWDSANDPDGDFVTYRIDIASSALFEAGSIISSASLLTTSSYQMEWTNNSGSFFYRVVAEDNKGGVTASLDWYEDNNSVRYNGILNFNLSIGNGSNQPPQRFYQDLPTQTPNEIIFSWDQAFDPEGDIVKYDFDISTSFGFESGSVVKSAQKLNTPSYAVAVSELPAGVYFYRVVADDNQGNKTGSDDWYDDENNIRHNGILKFSIFDSNINAAPLAFYQHDAVIANNQITFSWDSTIDPEGGAVLYDVDVATSADFAANSIIKSTSGLLTSQYTDTWNLSAGQYFYRVIARDDQNNQQQSLDWYEDAAEVRYNGILSFITQ